jgi:putative spermidine/putrescine transport system permease protein
MNRRNNRQRGDGSRAASLLAAPLAWLLVVYLGALAVLLITSFFTVDSFTGQVVHTFTAGNFIDVFGDHAYLNAAVRTLGVAVSVTLLCAVIAIPMSFYMARIASKASRAVLVALVLTPLWASYLVKVYSWRTMLTPESGVLAWLLSPLHVNSPGYGLVGVVITLTYLWLPYMVMPIYAGLERLPNSLLDASADLGAGFATTMRSIVLPMLKPAVVAGSVFTFSLSLGDYITVQIVGGKNQMLGNVVYQNFSLNLPFAAAVSMIPIAIMVTYLSGIRRTGALENL